ncbi:MAG: hypothetical protein ABSE00_01355 [Chitinispirillaceae bacterium]|jgi:hypothetical protein
MNPAPLILWLNKPIIKGISFFVPVAFNKLKRKYIRYKNEKEYAFFRYIAVQKGKVTEKERNKFFLKIADNRTLQGQIFELMDEVLRSRSTTAAATISLIVSENLEEDAETLIISDDDHILLEALDRISETEVLFFWYLANKIYTDQIPSKSSPDSDLNFIPKPVGGSPVYKYTPPTGETKISLRNRSITVNSEGAIAMVNDLINRRLFLPCTETVAIYDGVASTTNCFSVGRVTKIAWQKIDTALQAIDGTDVKSIMPLKS